MPFWRCYYHVIWATKNRAVLITSGVEDAIFAAIRRKAEELGSPILAINSAGDHIHLAVSIPPKLSIAEWVKRMKGVSTRDVNACFPDLDTPFGWQQGYGVLTFSATNLPLVVDYIERQKEHHASQSLQPYLEQIDDET